MSDTSRHDHLTELLRLDRSEEVVAEVEAALRLDPDDPNLLAFLADARSGVDPGAALEPALLAAARRPDDPATLITLSRVQWLSGLRGPARDTIDRAVELAPGSAEASAVRAALYLDEATRGLRTSPDLALFDQSLASATRATELAPTWPLAQVILGRAHLADHDGEQATRAGTAALSLEPDHRAAHVLLGDRSRADGDADRATDHYLRARPDPVAIDRLRTRHVEPWAAHRLGPLLVAVAAGTMLRMADAPTGIRAIVGLASAAIVVVLVAKLVGDARRAAETRTNDTTALLGAAGELAERSRPAPPSGAGQRPGLSSPGGGRTGPSA